MKPTRINWKLAAAAGTALGAGFGGLALASPSLSTPSVPQEIQVETTVENTVPDVTTTEPTIAEPTTTPSAMPAPSSGPRSSRSIGRGCVWSRRGCG